MFHRLPSQWSIKARLLNQPTAQASVEEIAATSLRLLKLQQPLSGGLGLDTTLQAGETAAAAAEITPQANTATPIGSRNARTRDSECMTPNKLPMTRMTHSINRQPSQKASQRATPGHGKRLNLARRRGSGRARAHINTHPENRRTLPNNVNRRSQTRVRKVLLTATPALSELDRCETLSRGTPIHSLRRTEVLSVVANGLSVSRWRRARRACLVRRNALTVVGTLVAFGAAFALPSLASSTTSGWSLQPTPDPDEGLSLYAVSCASPSACTAVGERGGGVTLAERWDGTRWSISALPVLPREARARI